LTKYQKYNIYCIRYALGSEITTEVKYNSLEELVYNRLKNDIE